MDLDRSRLPETIVWTDCAPHLPGQSVQCTEKAVSRHHVTPRGSTNADLPSSHGGHAAISFRHPLVRDGTSERDKSVIGSPTAVDAANVVADSVSVSHQLTKMDSCDASSQLILSDICDLITVNRGRGMGDSVIDALKVVISLIQYEMDGIATGVSVFPFCVIDDYVKGSAIDRWDRLMVSLCSWIGQQLFTFRDTINQKTEKFKRDFIQCLDNLPPTDHVIRAIFPPCMIALVSSWMSGTETVTADTAAIIQLILEFANGAYISGVSHVVHARLVHS